VLNELVVDDAEEAERAGWQDGGHSRIPLVLVLSNPHSDPGSGQWPIGIHYYLIVTSWVMEREVLPTLTVAGAGVAQIIDYAPGSKLGPRRLLDYEFVWIISGSATWTLHHGSGPRGTTTSRSLPLRPGTLLLAPSGVVDSFHWDPARSTRHAWAHFRVEDSARLPDPATWPLVRDLSTAPVLDGICSYLIELSNQPLAAAQPRSAQFLALLLDLFVRGPLAERPLPTAPPLVMTAMDAARRIWQVDGVRLITVGELARAASVSPGHLYRTFREHYGCGPAHALELIRLSRAAMTIQRSNASLADVARETGFANAYHLSRRFSAAYGLPPGKYRRDQATSDPQAPVRAAGLHHVAYLLSRT
jgi:AraC-like DNA-binding protein